MSDVVFSTMAVVHAILSLFYVGTMRPGERDARHTWAGGRCNCRGKRLLHKEMRKRYTAEFLQLFNMGFQNYSQGEWQARSLALLLAPPPSTEREQRR